jgi:hypothetical protein
MATTTDAHEEYFLLDGGYLYPVLPAALTASGKQMAAWCRYCDKLHYHGAEAIPGHRVAHCFVIDSPYRDGGYYLVPVPGKPEDLVPPKALRRRPKRPTGRDPEYRHRWRP